MTIKLLLTSILIPFFTDNPKVTFNKKTHDVYINNERSFQVVRQKCSMNWSDCGIDVYDKDTNRVIAIVFRSYTSRHEVTKTNPEGHVTYFEFMFLGSGQTAEMHRVSFKELSMAKYLIEQRIMKDGYLNDAAVDEFVFIKGTPFSDRRRWR